MNKTTEINNETDNQHKTSESHIVGLSHGLGATRNTKESEYRTNFIKWLNKERAFKKQHLECF